MVRRLNEMITLENARQIIYNQDALLSIKRSAWALYQHELSRTNPNTGRHFTPRRALSNTLRWMSIQTRRGVMNIIHLSDVETAILKLRVTEGLAFKQIAYRLKLPERTVKYRMAQVRARVGLSSTDQVVAIAIEYGLVAPPQLQK